MSAETATATGGVDVVRTFVNAYGRGDAESVKHLLHPEVTFRRLVGNGSRVDLSGRQAVTEMWGTGLSQFGPPEVLDETVEPVGPYVRWSTCWRMSTGPESSLVAWQALLRIEDGLITHFDQLCTGFMPESRLGR